MTAIVDSPVATDTLRSVTAAEEIHSTILRPTVGGKFLYAGGEKLLIKGVTYGTFRPNPEGDQFPDPEVIERDFALMAEGGINALRTYTVPPMKLLDLAMRYGLRVMVGIPWEQHVAFLDDRRLVTQIETSVRQSIRSSQHHPGILCYAIGNEIPAPIVRWHGRRKVEVFLRRLYDIAKSEDPESLVTYVNYPSTEYLQLPFLDIVSFNVYLETQQKLEAYLARLQNIAGDRPLLLAEVGLDSRRNGEAKQAEVLDWQLRTAFGAGCAGTFVFAWTDEWHRGGFDIHDWDFGITTQTRESKKAWSVVCRAFAETPLRMNGQSTRVSVAVCAYNASSTIRETLSALMKVNYPNFEVIVVDDGSRDSTGTIAQEFPVRLISTENRGLSAARNTALEVATGEIVAYLDADAYPDPDWLTYLTSTFTKGYAGVGGPNIFPPSDGFVAECVAHSPGGPIHVLVSDSEAEHIPGCNMAFRVECLRSIGGFDPQFHAAGDDVDVCWRLKQKGWMLGFSPAAVVWHHRRNTVRGYWKQQKGYGCAEGMLEKKWPEYYDRLGHHRWEGRLYGDGHTPKFSLGRSRIYHGTWGTGLFQSLYGPPSSRMLALLLTPEWYYVIAGLAGLSTLTFFWKPLIWTLPLTLVAAVAPLIHAVNAAVHARLTTHRRSWVALMRMRILIGFLHLMQPFARLIGRVQYGLTPWRRHTVTSFSFPWRRTFAFWHERRNASEQILSTLGSRIRTYGPSVISGGDYDRWDLEIRAGSTGAVRVQMAIEEHESGKQLVRFRCWPVSSLRRFIVTLLLNLLAILALIDGAWLASAIIGTAGVLLGLIAVLDCAVATSLVERCLRETDGGTKK